MESTEQSSDTIFKYFVLLGFKDIRHGYTGCMDDVRLSRSSIPLHVSTSNSPSPSVLIRFSNVEFSCADTQLVAPGPCSNQPCYNGGSCLESGLTYECKCHARFRGKNCELDGDPCSSQPCLYGGRCKRNGKFTKALHYLKLDQNKTFEYVN